VQPVASTIKLVALASFGIGKLEAPESLGAAVAAYFVHLATGEEVDMYALMRLLPLGQLLSEQLPAMLGSLIIAEVSTSSTALRWSVSRSWELGTASNVSCSSAAGAAERRFATREVAVSQRPTIRRGPCRHWC